MAPKEYDFDDARECLDLLALDKNVLNKGTYNHG